ncbi:hypothetical protein P5V15_008119 [Pogonomyrmex californicus]
MFLICRKYEKLQSEVDKSNDKALAKELSILEKELSAKEEEINAVIGLYKEVRLILLYSCLLHILYIWAYIVFNDIAKTGDDAEAANENVARKKQPGLHYNQVDQGNRQEFFSHVDYIREISLDESGADHRFKKSV